MNKISKELENFLFDLGFENKNTKDSNTIYYTHRIYGGLKIQGDKMIFDSSLYEEKIEVEIDEWNKTYLLQTYSECIELHGIYRGESALRYEVLNALKV